MTGKDETSLSEEDVRQEHLKSAQPGAHWAYLFGVMAGSFVLMVILMAILGG